MIHTFHINFNSTIELTPLLTTLLSVIVVVAGWIYNQIKNRKNEIAKEARSHRLEMLNSFMKLFCEIIEKNDLVGPEPPNEYGEGNYDIPAMSLWATVHVQIKIYGKNDEIKLYEEIMSALYEVLDPNERCITDETFGKLHEKAEELAKLCTNRIRKELKMDLIK